MKTVRTARGQVRDLIYNFTGCALHQAESLTDILMDFEQGRIDDSYIRHLSQLRNAIRSQISVDAVVDSVFPKD